MAGLEAGHQSDIAPKIKGGGSEVVSQVNVIGKYAQLANNIQEQIDVINDARKENTGIVGGIGDWVGEKTGAYSTGKETYEAQIKRIQDRAKALYAQIINELNGKTFSESEQTSIDSLVQKLEKSAGAKLDHVSWARAVSNSLGDNPNASSNLGSKTFHMTLGAMEGGYEGVAGLLEITGKAVGICTAYITSAVSEGKFDTSVGKQISTDVSQIFSLLTLVNAKKAIAYLPKALESFMNAKPDVRAEGFGKFFGMILIPLGIGAKTVTAAKAVGEAGMATVKAGAAMIQKGGVRAVAAGMATVTLGTGELAVAGTAVAGGTAVRYVGEMGAGGKGKVSEKALKEARMAKAEAHSGVSRETVLKNASIPDTQEGRLERLSVASKLLGSEMAPKVFTDPQGATINRLHEEVSKGVYQNGHKELRTMVEELDKVGFSREEGRKLMENGVLGSITEPIFLESTAFKKGEILIIRRSDGTREKAQFLGIDQENGAFTVRTSNGELVRKQKMTSFEKIPPKTERIPSVEIKDLPMKIMQGPSGLFTGEKRMQAIYRNGEIGEGVAIENAITKELGIIDGEVGDGKYIINITRKEGGKLYFTGEQRIIDLFDIQKNEKGLFGQAKDILMGMFSKKEKVPNSTKSTEPKKLQEKNDIVTSSPSIRRTESLTPILDVSRPTDVLMVGDLHGNVQILYKNLKSLGVVNSAGHWSGGNKRLVFQGDVIADRGTTGLDSMREIARLRKEANQAGGDITLLAGNHEDIAISFLTRRNIAGSPIGDEGGNAFSNALRGSQGLGIIEFARDYLKKDIEISSDGLLEIGSRGPEILAKMRQHPDGQTMLENMCQMKIVEHIDDTLFVHTDLTSEMAQIIEQKGIDWINQTYQRGLRDILIHGKEPSGSFQEIVDTFLYVYNRKYLNDNEAMRLKGLGFNRVVHGHTDKKGTGVSINGLELFSVDMSAGKRGKNMDQRSIGRISTNGGIQTGLDAVQK